MKNALGGALRYQGQNAPSLYCTSAPPSPFLKTLLQLKRYIRKKKPNQPNKPTNNTTKPNQAQRLTRSQKHQVFFSVVSSPHMVYVLSHAGPCPLCGDPMLPHFASPLVCKKRPLFQLLSHDYDYLLCLNIPLVSHVFPEAFPSVTFSRKHSCQSPLPGSIPVSQ